jgi:hypothetical protein
MKRVLEQDGDMTTIYHDLGDKVVIQKVQDVSPILEANKAQYNAASGRMGDLVHVGRIPKVVMDRWIIEDGINYLSPENKGLLLKKLEQRDNRLFKVHPGKFA